MRSASRAQIADIGPAVAVGTTLSIQAYVNANLGDAIGSAVSAALVNFSVGTVVLAAIVVLGGGTRSRIANRPTGIRAWWLFGGISGAVSVAASAAAAPLIGVSLLVVGLIGGQMIGSLLADHYRLSPGGPRPITRNRLAAGAIAVAAVALSAIGHESPAAVPVMALLVVVGIMNAVSSAAQGRLADAYGSSLVAALINFLIGTGCLIAMVAAIAAIAHGPTSLGPAPIWTYGGGFLGATGLTVSSAIVGSLGVLRLSLCRITGQLAGSLALDAALPFSGHAIDVMQVVAVAFVGVATIVASRGDGRIAIAPSADSLESAPDEIRLDASAVGLHEVAGAAACSAKSSRARP